MINVSILSKEKYLPVKLVLVVFFECINRNIP